MLRARFALTGTLVSAIGFVMLACSAADPRSDSQQSTLPLQEVGFNLRTTDGELLRVAYQVADAANALIDVGEFQTPEATNRFRAQLLIPVGSNYQIRLSGVATVDGRSAPCTGSQTFNVLPGATTQVPVELICVATGNATEPMRGTANVNATLEVTRTPGGECGIVTTSIGPLSQFVGFSIDLAATVVGAGVNVEWSATAPLGGVFANSQALDATFRCTEPSAGTIQLSLMGLNGCTDSLTAPVTCIESVCGDGVAEGSEICDDGNQVNTDACPNDCNPGDSFFICGNGIHEPGEVCDDGNSIDNDACQNDCQAGVTIDECRDGAVQSGEECDDGNSIDTDACRNDCTRNTAFFVCGNGIHEPGEVCDDGNSINTDNCKNDCSGF
jgi:cysteine-rich repeat protein